jgi:chitinase
MYGMHAGDTPIARETRRLFFSLIIFACATNGFAQTERWVSGFWVGWQSDEYPPEAIDFNSLTQVVVFALKPNIDGSIDKTIFIDEISGPRLAKEVAARAHSARRKVLICIGGEYTAREFVAVSGPRQRHSFVKSLVQIVDDWGFDGIDIDWEPIEPENYELVLGLIAELRAQRSGMTITADIGFLNVNAERNSSDIRFFVRLSRMVDQLNIMTYGMSDGPSAGWTGWVSWHSSALYGEGEDHPTSVSSSVDRLLQMGIPSSKVGIGIGFYGIGWIPPIVAPLQKPNESHVVLGDNDLGYRNIMKYYYDESAYRFDITAKVPYLSFTRPKGEKGITYISYEDRRSISEKGDYVRSKGLGGVIIWHINEGYLPGAKDPNELLHAAYAAVKK